MNTGDTPRTDAEEFHSSDAGNIMCVRAEFARTLERDLARLSEQNEALRKALDEAIALRVKLYRHSDIEGDTDSKTDEEVAHMDCYTKNWQAAIKEGS